MPIDANPPDSFQPVIHSASSASESFMDNEKIRIASNDKVSCVRNIGQVESLDLPDGFVEGKSKDDAGGFFQSYHLGSDPEIKLYLEYRGFRMGEDVSKAFHSLLSKPPHAINNAEVKNYLEVYSQKYNPDDYKIDVAETQNINGKTVLVIERVFQKFELKVRTLYVDSDGSGSAIQEISFQTPTSKSADHFANGVKALQSIKWK